MQRFPYIDANLKLSDLLETSGRSGTDLRAFFTLTSLTRAKFGLSSHRRVKSYHVDNGAAAIVQCRHWLQERGYVIFRLNYTWMALREADVEHVDSCVHFDIDDTHSVHIDAYGDAAETKAVQAWAAEQFHAEGVMIHTASHINARGGINIRSSYVAHANAALAHGAFYPWLDLELAEYFRLFLEAKEAVLVLFGPPGTGKSTFLRTLIHASNSAAMLAYNSDVIKSPVLLERFYEDKAKLLICEDIDTYLTADRTTADNQLMASLLNASDGVLHHPGKKLVFSTNLPSVERIDPALLRIGRCFDILEFRELTPGEASAARQAVGRAPKDLSAKTSWTLAEALDDGNAARQCINRFAKKARVGFAL